MTSFYANHSCKVQNNRLAYLQTWVSISFGNVTNFTGKKTTTNLVGFSGTTQSPSMDKNIPSKNAEGKILSSSAITALQPLK